MYTVKKTAFYILIMGGVMFLGIYAVKHNSHFKYLLKNSLSAGFENTIRENTSTPVLGVFSFDTEIKNQVIDSFVHYTLKITDTEDLDIKRKELPQIEDTIPLMITIETWGTNSVEGVVKGMYDNVIKQLCTQLIGIRPHTYMRFNPEMEVPVNRYPWQYIGGPSYIEAFRHFAELSKKYAPQVKLVWGSAGYPGALEYYPGDEFVDAVSVTLKSDSELSLNVYPNYPVTYNLFRRLHRLRFINKPIFILGSNQCPNDSINDKMVFNITKQINKERDIIYSSENFNSPETKADNDNHQQKIQIGLYDPKSLLNSEPPVTVEHIFTDFVNIDDKAFQKEFNEVIERGHNIIVTFEPFYGPNEVNDFDVLQNVLEGKYDREINQLYSIILSTDKQVYLRYAHEMEIPITRYPWQSQDPATYIKSYRYFMNFKDSLPSNINRVWGPAGDRGSLEWWPGNDVVDFVSIAIYGLPDKNITDPEKQESFATIFNRKYWRLRFVDKPLFITEFGVKGPEEYQIKWLEEAAKVIRINPQIIGINYFNMSDTPLAWGEIKPPDWSITKKSFYRFLEVLNEQE